MFFLRWEKCITETLVTREAFVKKRLRLTMKYLSAGKFITVKFETLCSPKRKPKKGGLHGIRTLTVCDSGSAH